METGNMDRLITIQQEATNKLPSGQQEKGWEDLPDRAVMWASKQNDKGAEGFKSSKKSAERHNIWKVHYRDDLDETMTIVAEDRWWDITRIKEIQRRRGILIYATWTQGKYDLD